MFTRVIRRVQKDTKSSDVETLDLPSVQDERFLPIDNPRNLRNPGHWFSVLYAVVTPSYLCGTNRPPPSR